MVEAEKLVAGKMAGEVALVQCSQQDGPFGWPVRPGQAGVAHT